MNEEYCVKFQNYFKSLVIFAWNSLSSSTDLYSFFDQSLNPSFLNLGIICACRWGTTWPASLNWLSPILKPSHFNPLYIALETFFITTTQSFNISSSVSRIVSECFFGIISVWPLFVGLLLRKFISAFKNYSHNQLFLAEINKFPS